MKKIILLFLPVFVLLSLASAQLTKQVLPTKALVKWANSEIGVLIHFDLQVFEPTYNFRKDWNYHPDLSIFNPKELDTDQWIRAAKSMGATYVVLVAKHCSGFSLWPTKAHPYSVKNTPWRNGQGDILKDFMASCKKFGLKPGIYASTTANGYLKVDCEIATYRALVTIWGIIRGLVRWWSITSRKGGLRYTFTFKKIPT